MHWEILNELGRKEDNQEKEKKKKVWKEISKEEKRV